MTEIDKILNAAMGEDRKTLSEYESTSLLNGFGIPTVRSVFATTLEEVKRAAGEIGYPVVLKICSSEVSHKTEMGLVALDLRTEADLEQAFHRISEALSVTSGGFMVQEMITGDRELVMGLIRDPQFGPCVMFGLGGIFTEILGDVSFRPAPLSESDAGEMIEEIKGHKILGAVRGKEAVDSRMLIRCLIALGRIGVEREEIAAIDVNPLIVQGNRPVAVDALVLLR